MPAPPFRVPTDAAGTFEIVKPGDRIDAVNIFAVTRGVAYQVKIGNNDAWPPTTGRQTITMRGDNKSSDVQEGVWIIIPIASPNGFIGGSLSTSARRA